MIKKDVVGYKGMSKDLSRDKKSDKYFDAKNIRILATDQKSSFAVTNELGNELIFEIPKPFVNIDNTQIEYTVNGVLKTISYKTTGSQIPRCEIEEIASRHVVSGETETVNVETIVVTFQDEAVHEDDFEVSYLTSHGPSHGRNEIYVWWTRNPETPDDSNFFATIPDDSIPGSPGLNSAVIFLEKITGSYGLTATREENVVTIELPVGANSPRVDANFDADDCLVSFSQKSKEVVIEGDQVVLSGEQVIIGVQDMRDSALIVTTDDNGFDCYWELKGIGSDSFDLDLLYLNNLSLSKNNLVQILYNYENSVLQKVYMVDGSNQLRFFNIKQSVENGDNLNLIDLPKSAIDTVSDIKTTQPYIESVVEGGSHTSGMIQYACNFYRLNGSQTTISPLSEIKDIGKGNSQGGGGVNESMNKSVLVKVSGIDKSFSHIKLYSIKYTSYNENPEIKIVADKEIGSSDSFSFVDTGGEAPSISIEAFTFLGSSPVTPKHIFTKDNRLFPVNIKEEFFEVEIDTRAYSFDAPFGQLRTARIGSGPRLNSTGGLVFDQHAEVIDSAHTVTVNYDSVPKEFDCVNRDYKKHKFRSDGVTLGGSGKYIEVEFLQSTITEGAEDMRFFKDNELYRLGIKFYNNKGQFTEPKWIMDFVAPEGNLEGKYNQLKIILTNEFSSWINDSSNFEKESDKPVGYKVLRSKRDLQDRTIITQGILAPMIAHVALREDKLDEWPERIEYGDSSKTNKMPSMIRVFEDEFPMNENNTYRRLHDFCTGNGLVDLGPNGFVGKGYRRESYRADSKGDMYPDEIQYGKMMQMFSPEVSFSDISFDGLSQTPLSVKGIAMKKRIESWAMETNSFTKEDQVEIKFHGGINKYSPGTDQQTIEKTRGDASFIGDHGIFGKTGGDGTMSAYHILRDFTGTFFKNTNERDWQIYKTPELTERGQGFKNYNGDGRYNYSNNLKTMLQDEGSKGVWSNGERCVTIVGGSDDPSFNPTWRPELKDLWLQSSFGGVKKNGVLVCELVKEENLKYTGLMYGGMSYSAKKSSNFIEIGEYQQIENVISTIESPGDTYVQTYKFLKLARDDEWQESEAWGLVTEIVYVNIESTIDLKNRNDISVLNWDSKKHPKEGEYQDYNRVYSQEPTLSVSSGLGDKIKKINEFDTRISASKEKIPGEFVDSWTDMLENEYMDLDGKYGPINSVVNLKDEIFCLQDNAVSHIAINPRVQINPDDGISLELGSGGILHDYSYKSTEVGTLNKWGVVSSENSFYFADTTTKGIMAFGGKGMMRLSDINGMHYELKNRMKNSLSDDNPVLGSGVSCGYNSVNSDVYFSFLQKGDNFTLAFNEKIGQFVSYYDYVPSWYLTKGDNMISTDPTNKQLWEHFKGNPNHFYGTHYRSSMTMHVAPEGNEIILNNASFKMELTDMQGQELMNKGLTKVRVYNDYQDSGEVELVMRKNMFKKFRNWKLNLPRQKNSRERIRSSWGFVEIIFDNTDKNRLILHDMTIFYTQH